MVQIIENRSMITGDIVDVKDHATLHDYKQVWVNLIRADDFENFPNLAVSDIGVDIQINIPKESYSTESFSVGTRVTILVRKSKGAGYFLTKPEMNL